MSCVAVVSYDWEHVATRGVLGVSASPWQAGMGLPSSLNDTLPVGTPDPGPVTATVAVEAMVCPTRAGSCALATSVEVAAGMTVWAIVFVDEPPTKLSSPS